jgi:ABC-type oligopeptide transport system substrate-binding subunit
MVATEEHLVNEYPIAPLYLYVSKRLVSPSVENFMSNVLDHHPSQYMKLK